MYSLYDTVDRILNKFLFGKPKQEHSSGKTANSNCDDASSVVPRIDNCDVVTDRELEGHQGPGSSQDSPAVNPKALNVRYLIVNLYDKL